MIDGTTAFLGTAMDVISIYGDYQEIKFSQMLRLSVLSPDLHQCIPRFHTGESILGLLVLPWSSLLLDVSYDVCSYCTLPSGTGDILNKSGGNFPAFCSQGRKLVYKKVGRPLDRTYFLISQAERV